MTQDGLFGIQVRSQLRPSGHISSFCVALLLSAAMLQFVEKTETVAAVVE
jgi:hypothetical protein